MNLLSPFHGGKYMKFPDPEMPGQYEGFNYLGLGVLLAFALAWVLNRSASQGSFARHRALTWLMFLFTAYALSDTIYLGVHEIVSLHYPPSWTASPRSSVHRVGFSGPWVLRSNLRHYQPLQALG